MSRRFSHTTSVQALWTPFVMHRVIQSGDSFNQEVREIATEYDTAVREMREGFPGKSNNLGYGGYDLITYGKNSKVIKDLVSLVTDACKDFVEMVYGYRHDGDMMINAGTFRQHGDQNLGIPAHTHNKRDLVAVYYPVIDADDSDPMKDGSLRLFDPANIGKRFWACSNEHSFYGNWYAIKPEVGSLVVFEGWIPHDSGYFKGNERLSIPFLIDLVTDKKHTMTSVTELMSETNGI